MQRLVVRSAFTHTLAHNAMDISGSYLITQPAIQSSTQLIYNSLALSAKSPKHKFRCKILIYRTRIIIRKTSPTRSLFSVVSFTCTHATINHALDKHLHQILRQPNLLGETKGGESGSGRAGRWYNAMLRVTMEPRVKRWVGACVTAVACVQAREYTCKAQLHRFMSPVAALNPPVVGKA